MATKLIIGLGNPGQKYGKTRHNFGAMTVQRLAEDAGVIFKKSRYVNAESAEMTEGGTKVLLILPLTYMNLSGHAVRDAARFAKAAHEDMLVVCDDINLEFGEMRLRMSGSDGGHNGLKSVIAEVGSRDFARLKLGVGAPPAREIQADYVLGRFSAREAREIPDVLTRAAECCRLWLSGESPKAMSRFNKRKEKEDNE